MSVSFHQYETEPLQLIIEQEGVEKPLEGYEKVAVSFDQSTKQGCYHQDFLYEQGAGEIDVENSCINLVFTQEQSGKFMPCDATVEVNILYEGGDRVATCEGTVKVFRNLYKKVM